MRICFFAPRMADCGGVQRVIATIANGFIRNHEVTIISLNNEKKTSFYPLDRRIHLLHYNGYVYNKKNIVSRVLRGIAKKYNLVLPVSVAQYIYYPQNVKEEFLRMLKQGQYDCIIAATIQCSVFLGVLAEHLQREILIGWHHNSFEIYFRTPVHGFYIQSKLAEQVLQKLDVVVTLTFHDSQEYKKETKINCQYIYNPLSFTSKKKADMSKKVLLYVGRLERKQKGIDLMIQIAEDLFHRRGYTDWKLKIVGDGSGFEDTKCQIEKYQLESFVELLGEKEQVIDYYTNASVFLSTSRWEGFGLVVIEAMECGLPVVSFQTDGPSEIIQDGKNGFLIENYDIVRFADAVERLMNEKETRVEMSKNAILRAKDFHLDHILREWEALIEQYGGE